MNNTSFIAANIWLAASMVILSVGTEGKFAIFICAALLAAMHIYFGLKRGINHD